MTTAAIMMVKDELDIIVTNVNHLLTQVDYVLVADNGSTDGTREQLAALRGHTSRLAVFDDDEIAYYQSRKMSSLAQSAAAAGAEWVLPVDADEIWYSPFGRIGDVLDGLDAGFACATAELYDHVSTAEDPEEFDPVKRIGWRRTYPAPLHKVAVRPMVAVTLEQGNHGAHWDTSTIDGLLVIRHFPYRSAEQMARKSRNGAAAYAATDLPEESGQHWRGYGRILDEYGDEGLADVFRRWFWVRYPRVDDRLIYDPAPCQSQ